MSVTDQCARWIKKTNVDPILCDRPRPSFNFESQSDAPPQGPGLPVPPNFNPFARPQFDPEALRRLADLSDLVADTKTAPEKPTSEVKAPASSTPATTLPFDPDRLRAARIARLARETTSTNDLLKRQLEDLTLSNERTQFLMENMRREGAKKDKQENAKWVMETAGSLWATRNVATEETVLSFLRSNTNNSPWVTKLAPQVVKLLKSGHSGRMLLLAMGVGATYYLYEWFGFDQSVKPVAVIRDGRVSALPRP